MMRITVAAILVAALCGGSSVAAQEPSTPDHGAFVMSTASDTIVIERFDWSADTLRGSIAAKGQPRLQYRAVMGPGGSVTAISIDVYPASASADAKPLQRVTITMAGDSAAVETNGNTQRFPITRGALPLMNNSFALSELLTKRARALGDSADIPVWALSGAARLVVQVRPIGKDSMTLAVAGQAQRLRVDAAGRILGGTLPAQHIDLSRVASDVAATLKLGQPDYSAPSGAPYTAIDVALTGQGGIPLGGTLTMPVGAKRPVPAVVTITGSGQQDRDEYISIVPGGYRLYRQVADTLGRRGIAVLRLDDRMVGASGGQRGTSADYADDIRAAVAWLRARPGIDGSRLALIGHSEGGMIAPMVAATDSSLKAIVLLAGPADAGLDIIHFQQRQAIEGDSAIPAAARDSAIRAAAVALDSLAAGDPWLGFFVHYNPLPTARRVRAPALILQGATDHQVTPEQAGKLALAMRNGGDRDVTVRVFPGLDHLFLPDSSGLPSGYTTLTHHRVAPEVLGTIADWLVAHLRP